MFNRISERISSAHLISMIALFVAMGGTALALKSNSVKSKHIKNGQVKSADVKDGGLKGKDVSMVAEFDSNGNINIDGTNSNQTVASVTIKAPRTGKLLISGGFKVDNAVGDDIYSCDLLFDGAPMDASSRGSATSDDAGSNDNHSCETSDGIGVEKGTYAVDLRASGIASPSEIEDSSLQAIFVPN